MFKLYRRDGDKTIKKNNTDDKNNLYKNTNLLSSNVMKNYNNKSLNIEGINERVVSKIPVILSRIDISICINVIIKLSEDIDYIESIKNKSIINKIHFLKKTDTLFIKGKIRKTINYIQKVNSSYTSSVINNLKYFIVYIPFEICTKIDSNTLEHITKQTEKDDIYCEPICSKIIDRLSLIDDYISLYDNVKLQDNTFINDIMNLILQIDIMQNQFININLSDYSIESNEQPIEPDISSTGHNIKNTKKVFLPPIKMTRKKKAFIIILLHYFLRRI